MKCSKCFIWPLVVSFILSLSSCEDYLQESRETLVRGNVYDTNKEQPLVNTTVYIQAYETVDNLNTTNPDYIIYKNILDSVKTDAAGNYAITLTGEKYNLPPKWLVRLNNSRFKYPYGQQSNILKGQENKVDFKVIELHPLRLRIIVKDNPRPPLTVQLPQAHEKKAIIYGVNADSTILLMVIPNQVNEVAFHVVHPIRNNNVKSHCDTTNAKGFKPMYQSTHTVYSDKFFWESK
jgi:hypothetical protein